MDWLREDWFWTALIILFIWMHMKGHGAHGGHSGHGRQGGHGGCGGGHGGADVERGRAGPAEEGEARHGQH